VFKAKRNVPGCRTEMQEGMRDKESGK
jgi:hypothetical protein